MQQRTVGGAQQGTFGPLAGVRVIEFSQMVMGPSCGLILADLGADVIKIEPPKGELTRLAVGDREASWLDSAP
jgi:crotonobetainyl-CoA:carnitine CoA-transferase CaiB-like acyl-CoA transferase